MCSVVYLYILDEGRRKIRHREDKSMIDDSNQTDRWGYFINKIPAVACLGEKWGKEGERGGKRGKEGKRGRKRGREGERG